MLVTNVAYMLFLDTFLAQRQCRPVMVRGESAQPPPFMPNSRAVMQYTSCNGIQIRLPEARQPLDFPSVLQFVSDHTICR